MLGYSVSQYLSSFQIRTPLWGQKLIPLLDYILSNNYANNAELSAAYYQIVNKYTSTNELPLPGLQYYIQEMGYGYILDFFNPDLEGTQQLVQFLVLIHFLKGSRKGLELILNLMGIGGNVVEWYETLPTGVINTFTLEVDANTLTNNDNPQTFINFKTFVQNYVYPEVSFKIIYTGVINYNTSLSTENIFYGILTDLGEDAIISEENSLIISSFAISSITGSLDSSRTEGNTPYWYTSTFNTPKQIYSGNFIGDISIDANTITNIPSTLGLSVGFPIIGQGVPAGTIVSSIDSLSQITLSKNAIETLIGNSFSYNIIKVYILVPTSTIQIPIPDKSLISEIYLNANSILGSTTGNTIINSNIITDIPDTSNLIQASPITGSNIPYGTTINSIDSLTQIRISQNAMSTSVGESLNYYGPEFILGIVHPPSNKPITYSDIVDYEISIQIQPSFSIPVSAPSPPTNLSASINLNIIDLSWINPPSSIDGINIYRSTDGINYIQIVSTNSTITTYQDTVQSLGRYYYKVTSYNTYGESQPSNIIDEIITPPTHLYISDGSNVYEYNTSDMSLLQSKNLVLGGLCANSFNIFGWNNSGYPEKFDINLNLLATATVGSTPSSYTANSEFLISENAYHYCKYHTSDLSYIGNFATNGWYCYSLSSDEQFLYAACTDGYSCTIFLYNISNLSLSSSFPVLGGNYVTTDVDDASIYLNGWNGNSIFKYDKSAKTLLLSRDTGHPNNGIKVDADFVYTYNGSTVYKYNKSDLSDVLNVDTGITIQSTAINI